MPFPSPGELLDSGIESDSGQILYLLSYQGSPVKNPSLVVKITYLYTNFLEKAMAPHSSTLAWKIPWTEEPGRLQSMGSLRVGHD